MFNVAETERMNALTPADPDYLPINFEIRLPLNLSAANAQIAANEGRISPDAVPVRPIVMVANGPSAKDPALWEMIRRDKPDTVALNGSLKLFLAEGLTPIYWAACDVQPLVADFLPPEPPMDVIYLVASKCHPAVFERLRGRDVRIWRIDDYDVPEGRLAVPCAVSITLVAQSLFRFMGYHRFEMYGWDCCYLDGEHHATPQDIGPEDFTKPIILQDAAGSTVAEFMTRGPWVAELNDAIIQTQNLRTMGYQVAVHGPGLIGRVLRGRGLI